MISQLVKPNSFGKKTYSIDIEKVYKIIIDVDDKDNFIIKNYRRDIFKDHLLYSFSHNSDVNSLIDESVERLRIYTNNNEKQYFTDGYWKLLIKNCLLTFPK